MQMLYSSLLSALAGGIICLLAQILIDKTGITPAKILVGIVVLGVILGAVGIYDPLFKIFGCGVSLPLIGFGGNIANGVREAVEKEGALGILKGPFTAMSAGVSLALLLGLLLSFFFKGKSKKM